MNDYKNWKKKCSSQTALYNAFDKYGGFKYETVTFLYKDGGIINKDLLNDLEVKYINKYNTLVPNGYNIQPGGKSSSGYKKQYSNRIKETRILNLLWRAYFKYRNRRNIQQCCWMIKC